MAAFKPTVVLKKYFGLLDGQTAPAFVKDANDLKASDPAGYNEMVNLAASEIGCEITPAS